MAVWNYQCGGARIRIKDVDHPPPHCHVTTDRGTLKVSLVTLEPLPPSTARLTHSVQKCLRQSQEDMLAAWTRVRVIPPGQPWEVE